MIDQAKLFSFTEMEINMLDLFKKGWEMGKFFFF